MGVGDGRLKSNVQWTLTVDFLLLSGVSTASLLVQKLLTSAKI